MEEVRYYINTAVPYGSTPSNYVTSLYIQELWSGNGGISTEPTSSGMYYYYHDEIEPSPLECLAVIFEGSGYTDGTIKTRFWADHLVESEERLSKRFGVHIKWTNVEIPRVVYADKCAKANYLKAGHIFEVEGQYYVNDTSTIEYFGFQEKAVDGKIMVPEALQKEMKELAEFNKSNKKIAGTHCSGFGYHGQSREDKSGNSKLKIGIEIEKIHKLNQCVDQYKLRDTYGIIKENDSSLGSNGQEYVTGIISFDNVSTIISELKPIKHIIDLKFDPSVIDNAGGHINISDKSLSGYELAKELKCYMPLLYALYPKRAFKHNYSTMDKFDSLVNNPCKRAIYPKRNLLEIRIFPAIDDFDNLVARIKLVKYMMTHRYTRYSSIIEALFKDDSELSTIIKSLGAKPLNILKKYVLFSKLDEARITGKAQEIIEEVGVYQETKRTFKEWNEVREKMTAINANHIEYALGVEEIDHE